MLGGDHNYGWTVQEKNTEAGLLSVPNGLFIGPFLATWQSPSTSCSNQNPTNNKMAPYIGCRANEGEPIPRADMLLFLSLSL